MNMLTFSLSLLGSSLLTTIFKMLNATVTFKGGTKLSSGLAFDSGSDLSPFILGKDYDRGGKTN